MSARLRWKYQQAQKQGFKPQIPDGADEDSAEVEPEFEQVSESDSAVVSNKKGIFALFRSRLVRFFASVFAKVRSFQQSYLASITAEGPKEEKVPLFSQNEELRPEKKEDLLLAQQIEETSRQLTELHQNFVSPPLEKEEEAFDADDFDEAVRKARWKLISTAAVVLLCIGGFCAYQFVPFRGAKENHQSESVGSVPEEEDDSPFIPQLTAQLVEQSPPVAVNYSTPEISEAFEVPSLSNFEEESDFASMTAPSLDLFEEQDEPLDMAYSDPSLLESTEEEGGTSPIPSTFSFGASPQDSQAAQPLPGKIQGEIQGATITIHDSPVAKLPLPQTAAVAQRAAPAAPFAKQFQENAEPDGLDEEEPIAPKLAVPNQRYQDNTNEPAIQVPRRQRTLPFGDSPTQLQTPVEVKTAPPNGNRQYTVQDGDNLFNIARRELGDVTRWREISRLNHFGNNVGYLTPGTVISLPK